jgi:hypothetical protein
LNEFTKGGICQEETNKQPQSLHCTPRAGDWLSFCNKQFGQAVNGRWEPGGAGQLVRSSNFGMTWSLTNSHDAVGIGNDVTFVDISQNPEDPVSIPQLVAHSSLRGSTFRRFCAVSATVSESVDLWGQDDIVVTGSSPYSPWVVPASSSNHSFWEGGVRRTRDGGRTWLLSANTTAIKGFMGSYYSPEDNLVRDAVDHNTLYLMNDVAGISSSTDGIAPMHMPKWSHFPLIVQRNRFTWNVPSLFMN